EPAWSIRSWAISWAVASASNTTIGTSASSRYGSTGLSGDPVCTTASGCVTSRHAAAEIRPGATRGENGTRTILPAAMRPSLRACGDVKVTSAATDQQLHQQDAVD